MIRKSENKNKLVNVTKNKQTSQQLKKKNVLLMIQLDIIESCNFQ